MKYPVLLINYRDRDRFINCWSKFYNDKRYNEEKYRNNIYEKPLNEREIIALFEWKNGGKLSNNKLKSVKNNFINKVKYLRTLNPIDYNGYFKIFDKGGVIWRIFFLHIWQPQKYPIFDQHVYRAMVFLKQGVLREIPSDNNSKITCYITEYIPFFKKFNLINDRKVDKALWSFGKFIKTFNIIKQNVSNKNN